MTKGGARIGAGRPKGQGKFGEATKPMRIPCSMVDQVIDFIAPKRFKLPLYSSKVQAGFPSPADDHIEMRLDLNEYLVQHPAATFLVRATGDSMEGAGIYEGDILVVDRSLEPRHDRIVIASIEGGDLTVKRLYKREGKVLLMPENPAYEPIDITHVQDSLMWGVVVSVVRQVV